MNLTYPSDQTDAEWECVCRYLPPASTRGRPRIHPLRRILDAIFYVLRTDCAWRCLPTSFPPWQTVFYHFRRFRLNISWHALYVALHRARYRTLSHPWNGRHYTEYGARCRLLSAHPGPLGCGHGVTRFAIRTRSDRLRWYTAGQARPPPEEDTLSDASPRDERLHACGGRIVRGRDVP